MATSYKKTVIKSFPKVGEKITSDTLYWKNLQFPVTKKEHAAVTSIDFSPVFPYPYAVTSSARVQVYSSQTDNVVKSLTRFRETAHSASFRGDGNLLVVGGDESLVRLYDVGAKSLLRVFRGHNGPVHVSRFLSDQLRVLSGGNDGSVRVWDVPSEKQLNKYDDHTDYVRTGACSLASPDIVASGSYDHSVRVYDVRRPSGEVSCLQHGHPVESVLMHPAGSILVSAGGPVVRVWDLLAGGRLLASFSHHHKTVTALCWASKCQRLVSAGLDRKVKLYDAATFSAVHTIDFPAAVLSVAVAPQRDEVLCVGMSDGTLSIQHRKDAEEIEAEKVERKRQKKASYKYALQSKNFVPKEDEHVVSHRRREQLAKYDKYFRRFEHSKALDAAMDLRVRKMSPDVTVSVLQELIRRGAIKAALAGRSEKALAAIIKFTQKNISNPKFMSTLVDVSSLIIEVYADQVGASSAIDELLVRLKDTVDSEVCYMKELMEMMGTMDTILAAADRNAGSTEATSELRPSQAAAAGEP